MEFLKSNKFEIMDMPGMNTIAFVVNKDEEALNNGNAVLSLQKVDPVTVDVNGQSKKLFNVINENGTNKDLMVLLTLTPSKAILSTGELTSSGFNIKESNIPIKYGSILNQGDVEYKEVEYTPNLKRNFAIIDTESGDEVKPTLYMDEKTGNVKGRCKIMPNKSYVVLELKLN